MVFRLSSLLLIASLAYADNFDDVAAQATAARTANQVSRAIELYRQAVELRANWDEGWWFLGSLLYDSDQYAAARDALARFVQLDPKAAPGFALLGLSEFELRDYGPALSDIQSALAAPDGDNPSIEPVLRFHEAMLLARRGDFEAAMNRYAAFTEASQPHDPALLEAIGLAALRVRLTPAEIPPEDKELYRTAGNAAYLSMAGHPDDAEKALDDLVARYPNAYGVHYLNGCSMLGARPEHAAAELHRELQIDGVNAAAATMLAWLLLKQRDSIAALPLAQQAVREEPGNARAQYVLGRALAETGDVAAGIEHLDAAMKLDPADLEIHLALASAYAESGRNSQAREERLRCVQLARGTDPGAR